MARVEQRLRVVEQKKLCPKFYRLKLETGPWAKTIQPGQFIHIRTTNGLEPFFRRPFSVHRAGKCVEILYEVVGKGTDILSQKKRGDVLDVLAPLGNGFTLPPGVKTAVMVAGGVGVAPFLILSDVLKKKKVNMILLYGGRTRDYVFPMREFEQNGCKIFRSTDDGSVGAKGRVSVLFDKIPLDSKTTFLYTCGPRPMMAALQAFAKKQGLRGQASCEERMACGLGACLGCVVQTTAGYKTACYDGPVFDLKQIVFERTP